MRNSSKYKPIILHADMDHFFSAIEERENPSLKGKPVVVGADPKGGKGRGVVKTCNYEARRFGLYSGMPISVAWQLCPKAIYIRANYSLYKDVSISIMSILRSYSEKFQQWGLDEAFLDLNSIVNDFYEATKIAIAIKHDVLWHERLTCSIGIAPNKLVAKIASDFQKPDGLTVVTEGDVKEFLSPLPVRKMLWIGKKTEKRLKEIGINTIGDLAAYDISVLTEKFGVMGQRFHQWAHGAYVSEVGNRKGMWKSIGHERTFSMDTDNHDLVKSRINDICEKIYNRTTKHGILLKTVTVKFRYENYETYNHGKTLPFFTNCLQEIQRTAQNLAEVFYKKNKKIRLVGVRVSNLKSSKGQKNLNYDD